MNIACHSVNRLGAAAAATVAAVALATLAGCAAVGPNYEAPASELRLPFQHRETVAVHEATTPAPALDTWWKGFDDPALSLVIERALAQNLDLAAAMARVEQARAVARHAGADRLPQVGFDASAARQRQSLQSPLGKIAHNFPGYDRDNTLYDVGAGATWELDLAGGLKRGAEAADSSFEAVAADHLAVRVTVAAETADAYLRAKGARERIAVAQEQVRISEGLLEMIRWRLQAGLSTAREEAQAKAVLSQARGTIPPLRAELEQQFNRLDVLMGVQPGTHAAELRTAVDSRRRIQVPAVDLDRSDDGPARMLRRRPDVIAAERRLAASSARIGQAVAAYYPKVSLSALLGFESLGMSGLLSGDSFQPTGVLGLKWRLFDFGRVDAEVAQAKGANVQALAAYRSAMLRAAQDVEDAVAMLTELEAQSRELRAEVDAHVTARESAQDAYKGGAISLIEVLDEDRQLLTARDKLALTDTNDARAAVATFRAMGGGW